MKISLVILLLSTIGNLVFAQKSIVLKHSNNCFEDNKDLQCACKILIKYEDSSKLIKLDNGFLKNEYGHLFMPTTRFKESTIDKAAHLVPYFNGCIPQIIDTKTFKYLDGLFAKDTNFIYAIKGTSGGEMITAIDGVDIKSFVVLSGHNKYAYDKNNFYNNANIIEGFKPKYTIIIKDKKGIPISLKYKSKIYKLEN